MREPHHGDVDQRLERVQYSDSWVRHSRPEQRHHTEGCTGPERAVRPNTNLFFHRRFSGFAEFSFPSSRMPILRDGHSKEEYGRMKENQAH